MPERGAEVVLKALFDLIEGAAPAGVTVWRNEPLPVEMPAAGLMILTDGSPGEAEVTMSPLTYHYQHAARLDLIVEGATSADRDAAFDALVQAVHAAVAGDRSLGGRCDWVEAMAPEPVELSAEGALPIKAATMDIMLHYATDELSALDA
jgi:hypothetical protein